MRSPFRSCLLYGVLFSALVSSCSTCSRDNALDEMNRLVDSMQASAEGEMMRAEMRAARKVELRHMIDSIVTSDFTSDGTSFSHAVYVHNTWKGTPDQNRNALMTVVYEESGEVALISTLPGIRSNMHNRVEIEIADTIYTVDSTQSWSLLVADQYSQHTITEAKGEVLYVTEEKTLNIMEAIAAHPDAKITVRTYHDDERCTTYTLSDDDKKAIIASFRLSLLMKELAELEAQDVEYDD